MEHNYPLKKQTLLLVTAENTKGFRETCQINLLSLSSLPLAESPNSGTGLRMKTLSKAGRFRTAMSKLPAIYHSTN
jgi:hypothetical protein